MPLRREINATRLSGRAGLEAMGVTVWGSAVATEPSVRKVTGVFSGVECNVMLFTVIF